LKVLENAYLNIDMKIRKLKEIILLCNLYFIHCCCIFLYLYIEESILDLKVIVSKMII